MKLLLPLLLLPLALPAQTTLKVRPQPSVNHTTVEMKLEKYVAAVLAGEASVLHSDEALKAMAVAARTFAIYSRGRHASEGYDLCGTTHCQRLDIAAITPRLEAAAAATAGELLWSAGKPAFAIYSLDCGGTTEDASAVWPDLSAPYLRRHPDPYCVRAGTPSWEWRAKPADLLAALRPSQLRAPPSIDRVAISARTASGRARELTLAGGGQTIRISATALRFAIGRALAWDAIRSDRYEVDGLNFRGTGSGHGVGLCQRGADEMGKEGRSYKEILAFYYPGALPGLTGRLISWTRLASENIALLTIHPDHDAALLSAAEADLRELTRQTNLPVPRGIEIRVYPDVDTFRNATAEPGWVAAHTAGTRIDLQPSTTERAALRHELIHVLLEARATRGLPLWFREGLAGYLEHPVAPTSPTKPPADTALRQTADPQLARRAYAEATAAVATLVQRYGEPTVISWLSLGLPRDVVSAH